EASAVDGQVTVDGLSGLEELPQRLRHTLRLFGRWSAFAGGSVAREGAQHPLGRDGGGDSVGVGRDHDSGAALYARAPAGGASLKGPPRGVTVEVEASFMQRSVEGSALEPRACLDEQEVVDFAGGLLPEAKLASVEAHLAGCEACTALVAAAAPHLAGG